MLGCWCIVTLSENTGEGFARELHQGCAVLTTPKPAPGLCCWIANPRFGVLDTSRNAALVIRDRQRESAREYVYDVERQREIDRQIEIQVRTKDDAVVPKFEFLPRLGGPGIKSAN